MENLYKGYFKKTQDEIDKIWSDCLITFDTNVLLNLYRYSKEASDKLLKLMDGLSDRIFLTHQVGLEFSKNRVERIIEQEQIYKEFIDKNINKGIIDELNLKRHPNLSNNSKIEIINLLEKIKSELSESQKYFTELLKDDIIFKEINEIFKDKIEQGYSLDRLKEIYKEGEYRYKDDIPPGFKDKAKAGDNKYGDLVLWLQIIDKAKQTQKPIILVTGDNKIDWWWILSGRTIGPRQELIEEIWAKAGVDFHLYSEDKFEEFGSKFLQQESNKEVVEEIREFNYISRKQQIIDKIEVDRTRLFEQIQLLQNIRKNLHSEDAALSNTITDYEIMDNGMKSETHLFNLTMLQYEKRQEIQKLNSQLHELTSEFEMLSNQLFNIKSNIT